MKIKAEKREITGKKVKQLRNEMKVPAVVYGPERVSTNITLDKKSFTKTYKEIGHNIMADLEIDGEKDTHKVLVKDLHQNPLTGDILHADLYQIDLKHNIDVEVPFEFVGVSAPVKNSLGFLVTPATSVLVVCKPNNIPEKITIDISKLEEVNASINVSDVDLGEGVELHSSVSPEMVIARVSPPQKEVVETVVEAVEGEEGEEKTEEGEEKGEN